MLQRRNYLIDKIVVEPRQLLNDMPSSIGLQFQAEWALYSCSMLTEALTNVAELYPETKEESIATTDSLIQIVKSPELRLYDKMRWGENPLESLAGDESHVSYLSHLAWMIGNYRRLGGDNSYDTLHDSICETMNRRISQSPVHTYRHTRFETIGVMVDGVAERPTLLGGGQRAESPTQFHYMLLFLISRFS